MQDEESAGSDNDNSKSPVYIVGLGASAGGLEALEAFFTGMPVDTGMAFVVIQHLAPDFKSLMDELLARRTTMAIHKSENGMEIEPNSIYLIPPKKEMIIQDGSLFLRDRSPKAGISNLPIDIFFHSLAEDYKENSIGVVFSGTGSDGSKGIAAIHEQGGLVLCQTPESASFDGMPNSAIATNLVDVIVNPSEMADVLVDYTKHSSTFLNDRRLKKLGHEYHIYTPIFDRLKEIYDVDFQYYKPATIGRRIERRMSLTRNQTVDDYCAFISSNDGNTELESLYRDLLIGVTQFFRDDTIWQYIEKVIIPAVCEKCSNEEEVRFWVPGCATGEEAYSLAILIHEWLTDNSKPLNVRIFATDLHKDSLAVAGKGVYSATSVTDIHPARIKRYFIETDANTFEVTPEIRRMVVFAQHNVLKDPPFTKIDFISCRNLLIYFMNTAQKRAISLFHFALKVNGILFLGPSESLGEIKNEFEELNRRNKVYKKRRNIKLGENIKDIQSNMPITSGNILLREPIARQGSVGGRDINLIRAYDVLLQKYVPPSVLIEHNGTLAYTFGDATDYLHSPKGVSTLNILDVIHSDLRMAVSTGLQRVSKDSSAVSYGGIKVEISNDDIRIVRVTIQQLSDLKPSDYLLITFDEASRVINGAGTEKDTDSKNEITGADKLAKEQSILSDQHVQQLEEELRYTKENLQATVEELETSNEELQATNEELMASNEELQSTNEELHSVNEELYTVNREYEEKIDELTQLNDDMDNLLAATDIGTIFLDNSLKIRKFTPAAARQFSLISQDVGRPISHLNRNIEFDDFQSALEKVKETGEPSSYEVRNIDNRWYLMGLHPYLNEKNHTTGVVITFVEISLIKEVSNQISQRNEDLQSFAYAISHDLNEPVRILSNFTELLLKETAPHDDNEKLKTITNHIQDASQRLKDMLAGTLRFSRIVTEGENFSETKLLDCLNKAKSSLKQEIAEHNIRVVCDKLPVTLCDHQQITRVFVELLGNSIKFRKKDESLVVNISYEYKNDEFIISYKDNGIGIHIENPERVFHIFFTAHHSESDRGMGIGLAICKRIIERHHGTISFVYEASGSEFVIRLPVIKK